jgi:glycosyltransferase involved in cell wall biosynthesis
MHSYYGTLASGPVGQWYDRVIPPCFDTATFSFTEKKDDYFFMACRMVIGKGIHIAAQLAKKMGFKLKIAGPGDPTPYLIAPNIEYLGVLGPKDRNEVMCKAKALFSPSTYIEPFGMVVIEANLCGTPVITTDFGAFPENVIHGVSGYRCRTWAEFQFAVRNVDKLEPAKCRKWGENYSYEKVAPMYESYFQSLLDLNKDGWYSDNDPKDLSWLSKDYP